MTLDTRTRLIDAATTAVRGRGYHAVSFRELADALAIKSASVHYHFPRKEDLGEAIVAAYRASFFGNLEGRVSDASGTMVRLRAMRDVHREALVGAGPHCLCGLLGAEARGLPVGLRRSVNGFFEATIDWVRDALPAGTRERRAHARQFVATLQGAMMLASSMDDPALFDDAASRLLRDAGRW